MKAITKFLAGGVAIAAVAASAPAAAQYYPGNPGYGYGGNVIGQVINSVTGGGYGYAPYGADSHVAVGQCVGAVQQRLNGGYGGYGYNGGYNGYNGYPGPNGAYGTPYYGNGYGGGRVLGISRVEPRSGGLTVRGVASSGHYAGYANGYNGYNNQPPIDLTFRCKADYRGYVYDVSIERAHSNYGYNYTPYQNDYSQYGYRRY